MKKTKWVSWLVVVVIVFVGCVLNQTNDETTSMKSSSVENPVVKSALEPYIPPDPVAPGTFKESLGFATLDNHGPYTGHGVAADRNTLYQMFPAEARFYILNVTQIWFWGDGTSDIGGSLTHVYPRAGEYILTVYHDVNFRGGITKRITSRVTVIIPEPLDDFILTISQMPDMSGNPGMPPAVHEMTVINAGG